MPHRIAASFALVAFVLCLMVGGMSAGNTFSTTISRALLAMACSYVIGLIAGLMAQKMIDENLKDEEKKLRKSANLEPNDR